MFGWCHSSVPAGSARRDWPSRSRGNCTQGPASSTACILVDLAPVSDPDLVPATIARSIGIVDMGTGHDVERLLEVLRDLDLLLVLDNFEQVTPAAGFVAELLAFAPRVSILVTSRQPLHLRGEHEIAVPPLGSDDAVALFLARARAVNPGFAAR